MRKLFLLFLLAGAMTVGFLSCENDDTDFSAYTTVESETDYDNDKTTTGTGTDTIYIAYSGTTVTISNDARGVVAASGADVTVSDTASTADLVLVLSGTTPDGSLLVYRARKFTIVLNGVSITNADGPAINNQCGKSLFMICADGTTNTLSDGTEYATQSYDQKATLFSEGQMFFSGAGRLIVNGNCKNAIASDDYITIESDIDILTTTAATGMNGIKVNDGMYINGGTLTVNVASNGGRGIRCKARTVITGGDINITTTGDCLVENFAGVADTTSAACIKSDSLFTMSGGSLTVISTGDGGKGIRCSENIEFSGGTLVAQTTGSNDNGKPKALKSDTGILVSGGSFTAKVNKSWACDNGTDSDEPADHLTVIGTPKESTIGKRSVIINYE